MDKCWFVLSQTDFPPPQESDEDGAFKQVGPLCLGHFIQDLKHLDNVINTSGPEPFPLDMPIYRTGAIEFEWESKEGGGFDLSVGIEGPTATTPGITAKASLGVALKKTLGNSWSIERLETVIVEPTRAYLNRCLTNEAIVEFLNHNKFRSTRSIFIVTGLKIACGKSTRTTTHEQEKGISGGPGVGVAGVADLSVNGNISSNKVNSNSAKYTHDFVWAVRLSKITKGVFDKSWSHKTYSRGATFDLRGGREDMKSILSNEDLPESEVLTIDTGEDGLEYIVIPMDATVVQGLPSDYIE